MRISGSTVLVTGAAGGIGWALCHEFKQRGAANIVAVDLDREAAERVAEEIGGVGFGVDVSDEDALREVVNTAQCRLGPIQIACSNAGVGYGNGSSALASGDNASWDACWRVNVMSHVYLARALLPDMLKRREGHFVQVASAAGLLLQVEDAAYSATKGAAVSFAESIAITHGDQGIDVSLVCPQYVATPLLDKLPAGITEAVGHVITPAEVAVIVATGVEENRFLILPHPEVMDYLKAKSHDYDRWILAMRGLRKRALAD